MRVTKSAEDRKNEILDVAEQLFVAKGYDNTSTNDIIKVIGIARGTLYHHFASKEEILDSMIERMTESLVSKAAAVAEDKSIPLIERIAGTVMAMNVESDIGREVLSIVHRPQNALLHQKMQAKTISSVVPLIEQLIIEGNDSKIFDCRYPREAAEMAIVYSNEAFGEGAEESEEEMMRKITAFIFHTERILGAKEGSLQGSLLKIFNMPD